MGKVTVSARVENVYDSLRSEASAISPDELRSLDVPNALVDTGAKLLSLPKSMIEELGLEHFETRRAGTSAGIVEARIYRAVWLTVEGRRCTVDVAEVPDDCPVLIGYVPLELLDFVVDPVQQRLIPIRRMADSKC